MHNILETKLFKSISSALIVTIFVSIILLYLGFSFSVAYAEEDYGAGNGATTESNNDDFIISPMLQEENEAQFDFNKPDDKTIGDFFLSLNPFRKKQDVDQQEIELNALFTENSALDEMTQGPLLDRGHGVEDLAYGEILFNYFTEQNYEALIKARIAQEKNELTENKDHVILILAQLYIIEGLPFKAEQALKQLAPGKISKQTRDKTLFQLVRLHSYQGNLDSAVSILKNDLTNLPPAAELERRVLLSNIYVKQKNFAGMQETLDGIKPENTRNAYLTYNIASAGLLLDYETSALPLLQQIASNTHSDLESRSLRDKANLTLGSHFLKKEDYQNAYDYLSQVSYAGPHSSEALYYLGWIQIKRGDPKAAFPFWVDLSKRNPTDPFVGKSYLIRPYTLEKIKSTHPALSGYLRAGELYEQLLKDVDQTIEIINSQVWLDKLTPPSLGSADMYERIPKKPGWLKTQTNEINFLLNLYSSDTFTNIHQNFWELELLKRDLSSYKDKFAVFQLQQDTHKAKYSTLTPEAEALMSSRKLAQNKQRFEAIEIEMKAIAAQSDYLSAPSQTQQNYLQRIERLKNMLDQEPANQYLFQRRYLAMLEGILKWDMSQDANDRQWNIRRQYRELQILNEQTLAHEEQIKTGIKQVDYYQNLMPEINRVSNQLDIKLQQIELLSLMSQKLMRQQALSILEQRKSEYKKLKVRAQLAAARLQDNIVTGGK